MEFLPLLMSLRGVFVVAGVLAVSCGVESREADKRGQANLTTIADVAKVLEEYAKRIKYLESKQGVSIVSCKDGTPGTPGTPGQPGKDGRDGLPGKDGSAGSPGPRGRDGRDGQHGTPGPRGIPGKAGAPGIQGPRGPPGPKCGGVQYVRWGRTSCPSGANLVYKGRVGGENYAHSGGGSNYECLTETPKYKNYDGTNQGWSAYMYGAEYQTADGNNYNPFNYDPHDHEVPCAVCFVPNRSTKLMIPATFECPAGWLNEYWGYLMSERYSHRSQKDFICVDQHPEIIKGTKSNDNGALLYTVEGRCGSLPCLPYVEGRELTCVVCTK